MKKLFVITICAFLISACADKEQYEKAVLAEVKRDQEGDTQYPLQRHEP